MSKRSLMKSLFAVALSLVVLSVAAAPAQASSWGLPDPGVSLWSSFVDSLVSLLLGPAEVPPRNERKTTTTGGTTSPPPCPLGSIGCSSNQSDSGATADPFGKP